MVHFEPLPLLEAHFFLASRQAGSTVANYFSQMIAYELPDDVLMDEYTEILSELESRLNAAITADEADIQKLYGEISSTGSDADFPSCNFAANLLTGGLESFSRDDCFDFFRSTTGEIPNRIAYMLCGAYPDEPIGQLSAVDMIITSDLSDEGKVLLIDLLRSPDKYIAMLEAMLLPIAEEFSACLELVAPLLTLYKKELGSLDSFEAEEAYFGQILRQEPPKVELFSIYPLITYYHIMTFEFIDGNKGILMCVGVLHNVLRKYFRTDSDPIAKLSAIMNSLGSRSRFDILVRLAEGPQYGRELADYLGLTPATVSHHINVLMAAGLIQIETIGKKVFYSLNYANTEKFVDMLGKLLIRNDRRQA